MICRYSVEESKVKIYEERKMRVGKLLVEPVGGRMCTETEVLKGTCCFELLHFYKGKRCGAT